ncbi:PREDICTED: complement component 1 Q subcomponent-binding protein, mitochondrial-like [Priapulus caudatus]|uniref:Complement component 1 Q subcomponent-binding protein, mitochondrial-like n=1 Tax=Priapulus caudatus TaxID=37621 RepID=A0ABM1DYE6_PRICU|nr:PREDICTED: complement component 1 Q subcomponent-binding protein, mitochondrial-like [Priapulus caudatus]
MMVSGPSRLTQTGFGACNCGGCCGVHTKSDKDLSEFLTEEIEAEKSTVQQPGLPNVDGFDISTDGSVVTMVKAFNSEKVTLTFNVSNTVDVGAQEGQFEAKDEKGAEASSMVSKPDFTVEVKKGNQTLVFQCSIIDDMEQSAEGGETQEDGYADSFQIDEVAIHESEYTDSTYTVSADIMDGNLYDLFMNFLDERGVKNDFSDKLVQYATAYEHKLYIGLLEKLKGFVSS